VLQKGTDKNGKIYMKQSGVLHAQGCRQQLDSRNWFLEMSSLKAPSSSVAPGAAVSYPCSPAGAGATDRSRGKRTP